MQPRQNQSKLFAPIHLGPFSLAHRVVMPGLTRMRTVTDNIPNELMATYYAQRTTAGGFMIAEATIVSPNGNGYANAPGIYTTAQAVGWKRITQAVHAKGGIIFLQLYHAGRQSHVDLIPGGSLPVGPSVVEHPDDLVCTPTGWEPATLNRALETAEVRVLVDDFRKAAVLAQEAGFDGVELHGANGYLVDQFLQDGANQRTDEYGGSFANRSRFLMEIVHALVSVWGSDRVGVRLGPSGTFGSMSDSNPTALFTYATQQLNEFRLAYLHLIEPRIKGSYLDKEGEGPVAAEQLRKVFTGLIIAAGGFDGQSAEDILEKGDADLVAFGRYFISNPDLPDRLRHGFPLNEYHRESFYGGDEHGYTDYPFYEQQAVSY
ncbi:alkene reductase [Spirosoma endbachense]|uniref:Alkene reductase n=1 Tax=Spirosoma endbachense TaxID=2666025 RepID=A0A6P1W5S0_9BACT|nr:alkene reductase [Spirosoma endbachense]QHV99379.1 alkene reductase [Spirosoma endbachense]